MLIAASLVLLLNRDEPTIPPAQGDDDIFVEQQLPQRTLVYQAAGSLDAVSSGGSGGVVTARYYDDGSYELFVEFKNLAELGSGFFYEGWLVNQTTSEFFSTGALVGNSQGELVNSYLGDSDYQAEGYDFYVLTLEPDDGDPAPAEHIVEGKLITQEN